MRRRRQKNPLLMRIVGISILVHILILPVLAHFGAFKKIQKQFLETRLVTLPPPSQDKEKPVEKKVQKAARKAPTARKSASATPHAARSAPKSNLNQPKVVDGAGGGDDSGGPTVDANGSGKAGELPTLKGSGGKDKTETPAEPAKQPEPAPQKTEPPVKVATAEPGPKVEKVAPKPAPEPKKEPVYTDTVPISSPQPSIPDDLRSEALDKTVVAEFTVGTDGSTTNVKIAQSSGNDELDRLALEAARKWRFKPATQDGQPIESRVRLHIEFQVT